MKKLILLIEDDPKTEAAIKEALGKEYGLETAKNAKAAAESLEKRSPDLIIIDFDLKGEDGLQVFSQLGAPVRVIMLSASSSIPLAVQATKLGVSEFLRKPVNPEQLREAVERNISRKERKLRGIKDNELLLGESLPLKQMLAQIQEVLRKKEDIILIGEQGVPKEKLARFIHENGPRSERKMACLDLASFRRENLEAHFWSTLQELMALPESSSLQNEEDRCGTVFLNNLDNLDEHFLLSILNFLKERRGRIDKSIRAIIGMRGKENGSLKDFVRVEIPALRERREDIPLLLQAYLKRYCARYSRSLEFISTEVLDLLAGYDFPGNYSELDKLVREAVLTADSDKLELEHFPLHFRELLAVSLKQGLRQNLTLEEAKRGFEKKLYQVLLSKSGKDRGAVARFLDIPKTVLAERLENLLD
jgi:DNA-binding NtrC family response regulator